MLSLAKRRREKGTTSVNNAISALSSISCTDIVFQIFLRLPLKSLLVFKSVSKQWLSIITDPQFIREKHRIQHGGRLKIPGLFLQKGCSWDLNCEYHYICIDRNVTTSNYVPFKTLNFAGEDRRIVASCNGLFLCSNSYYDRVYCNGDLKYSVYNPFTKQYKILPPFIPPAYIPSSWSLLRSLSDIELAFDPLKSLYYNVICIWGDGGDSATKQIEIYSSETSSWRRCKKAYTFPGPGVYKKSCVLWNGSLNWVTNNGTLIYFNINEETLGEVLSPWEKNSSWYTDGNCLDVYGGHLLLLLLNLDVATCFDVLEMDTNYTGWIMKYKVDMEGLTVSYPELGVSCCSYKVIFIDEVEEFSPKFIVLIYDSKVIISYDSEENSCTIIHDVHELQFQKWPPPRVYKFVESLACV